jgi:DNA-binding transcriptional MerR regulator
MPTKEELLERLDFEVLKDIADNEGIKYPKDATKRFMVKLLGGVLAIETIRKYLAEYEEEEVEREITVKERLRRKTARVATEVTRTELSMEKMILDLRQKLVKWWWSR